MTVAKVAPGVERKKLPSFQGPPLRFSLKESNKHPRRVCANGQENEETVPDI
jgi:hypothetical protein